MKCLSDEGKKAVQSSHIITQKEGQKKGKQKEVLKKKKESHDLEESPFSPSPEDEPGKVPHEEPCSKAKFTHAMIMRQSKV